jgi:hypothetical protein
LVKFRTISLLAVTIKTVIESFKSHIKIDSQCKANKKSVSDQTSLGFFFVESKRKPELTFCIHGSLFIPHAFEIIDDKNSRKTADSMKIKFLIILTKWRVIPSQLDKKKENDTHGP